MTIQTTSTMIYIGNLPLVDVNESDGFYENAGSLLGTYGETFGDLEMVDITNFDVTEDGVIWSDEVGTGDYIEYTIDGVTYSGPQDAIVLYNATITERDGTVHNVEVSLIQAPNGDTFVNDKGNNGATDNLNIKTIELTSVTANGSAGRNTFATTQNTAVCFCAGTLIETPDGPRAIETLTDRDRVVTALGGIRAVRWVGVRHLGAHHTQPPVVIAPSALGPGYPAVNLRVSQQHRMLVHSPIAQRMFGMRAVFVAAKNLLDLDGVTLDQSGEALQYWHILCADHDILFANGLPAETLFPGPYALSILPKMARETVARIAGQDPGAFARTCAFTPTGRLQRKLISRHQKNRKPCLSGPLPRLDRARLLFDAGTRARAQQHPPEAARLFH